MLTPNERRRLVVDNLALVHSIARRVHRSTGRRFELEDLVSVGTEGLIQAAARYDGRAEATFLTFAYYRVRGAMLDAIDELSPLACHIAYRSRRSGRAIGAGPEASLADDQPPEESIDRRRAAALLDRALAALPPRKRRLIRRCYFEDHSLKDAGRELGVSKSWASRLHADALRQLREELSDLAALDPVPAAAL